MIITDVPRETAWIPIHIALPDKWEYVWLYCPFLKDKRFSQVSEGYLNTSGYFRMYLTKPKIRTVPAHVTHWAPFDGFATTKPHPPEEYDFTTVLGPQRGFGYEPWGHNR